MNTRILRMCERSPIDRARVTDLGQLQPVIFSIEHGRPTLRIEGVADRWGRLSACWWVLDLTAREGREQARERFAHLETCKRDGLESDAARVWREMGGCNMGVYIQQGRSVFRLSSGLCIARCIDEVEARRVCDALNANERKG